MDAPIEPMQPVHDLQVRSRRRRQRGLVASVFTHAVPVPAPRPDQEGGDRDAPGRLALEVQAATRMARRLLERLHVARLASAEPQGDVPRADEWLDATVATFVALKTECVASPFQMTDLVRATGLTGCDLRRRELEMLDTIGWRLYELAGQEAVSDADEGPITPCRRPRLERGWVDAREEVPCSS